MDDDNRVLSKYIKRINKYKKLIDTTIKPIRNLITMKLVTIVLMVLSLVYAYENRSYSFGVGGFIILGIVYIVLANKHKKLLAYKSDIEQLIEINNKGVSRLNGKWRQFKDNGSEFVVDNHEFAIDLDIVGKDSLFQWMNMCETPWGKRELARNLLNQNLNNHEVELRQEAILELSNKLNFRHRLKLESSKLRASRKEINSLAKWGTLTKALYQEKWFILLVRILPVLTCFSIILGPLLKLVPAEFSVFLLVAQSSFLYYGRKDRREYLDSVYKANNSISKLKRIFRVIEKHKHKSKLLVELRASLFNRSNELPSKQILGLSRIASNISNRKSSMYFVINILLLWDYQCCISLEKWKETYGENLGHWFEVIGKFEALSSFAVIKHDHPKWVIPTLLDEETEVDIETVSVGHPLVGNQCVTNSISFSDSTPIVLITGSNMSGKSTFLRTIGINLVLAYCGAPVFASEFRCKQMKVHTCMRVSDDLQNNISSFYGEILRIKMIIEKVKEKQKVFFLLDEIFKGTNSIDRHIAAKAVIHNLNKHGAIGMVSTHDLELDVIEEESKGMVKNRHFEEGYTDGEITFDYKLKEGVSTTRNAIYLIKAAGIDM